MNVNVALIRNAYDGRFLKAVTFVNVSLFPADLIEQIIASGLPSDLASLDYNAVLATIKDANHSYSAYVLNTTTGEDLYIGFSVYSMYAAIGAAALKEFEDNEGIENAN